MLGHILVYFSWNNQLETFEHRGKSHESLQYQGRKRALLDHEKVKSDTNFCQNRSSLNLTIYQITLQEVCHRQYFVKLKMLEFYPRHGVPIFRKRLNWLVSEFPKGGGRTPRKDILSQVNMFFPSLHIYNSGPHIYMCTELHKDLTILWA